MIVDIHAHIGHHPIMDFKQRPEEVLDIMDKFCIETTFMMPYPSMKINKINDHVAEAVKTNADRLIGFACIDPSADDVLEEVERIAGLGLKGIMLDPEFHHVFWGNARTEELMVPCMDYGLPVLFNTPNIEVGESESMGRDIYFKGLNSLALKFPQVRFLVSPFWPRIKELLREHKNIIIDTGGRNGVSGAFRLAREIGPTLICFGSESPQNHPALGIKEIRTRKLASVFKDLILGKNAKRIFRDLF
jgi:predicted TIM-barrel fold metal-dependent hydrolase